VECRDEMSLPQCVNQHVRFLIESPTTAGTAALLSDFMCMNNSPKNLFPSAADATQALRTKKKIKAMTRISPSKPPPMYMEFPFINDSDAAIQPRRPMLCLFDTAH
jgi:hypothetical protein